MCKKSKLRELLWEIFVLLGYLGRQNNNRLQAQFEDTRSKLPSHPGREVCRRKLVTAPSTGS